VRCLAFALAHLPAIATGTARRWRRRRLVAGFTDREDEDPAELPVIERCPDHAGHPLHACNRLPAPREPDQATARPIGSRYAVSPSTWPTCRRSPPGTARRWRRRRFVAGFTDREDEGPDRTAGDRALPARATATRHTCNRCLPAPREPDQATARPIGSRCAVSPSPWPTCRRSPPAPLDAGAVVASWPASPIERTKPDRTAGDRALPARATPAATATDCPHPET
jgi:hypothetical protein